MDIVRHIFVKKCNGIHLKRRIVGRFHNGFAKSTTRSMRGLGSRCLTVVKLMRGGETVPKMVCVVNKELVCYAKIEFIFHWFLLKLLECNSNLCRAWSLHPPLMSRFVVWFSVLAITSPLFHRVWCSEQALTNDTCVRCEKILPRCHCRPDQVCDILAQTCHKCSQAICRPKCP